MMRCAVVGAGAWGTALADLLARNGHDTTIWAREPDVVESINESHENRRFLPGARLHSSLRACGDMTVCVAGADVVTLVPPSFVLRETCRQVREHVPEGIPVVVASKGIERDTLVIMTDVVEAELPNRDVVAFSGPSFAAEVASRQPTAVVAASHSTAAAERTQLAFSSAEFRVYTNDDVIGVELGGSLKNVMAVATGIAEGLGLGFNSRAALITRGLAEMTRLGTSLGARASTFAGLAGIGDLVLTCTGSLSRNRALGVAVGEGATLEEALAGRETVAEGVFTAQSAMALARRQGVEMPIVSAVHRVLFEGSTAALAMTELMTRELRAERD